jgi:hypothetical protein
MIKQNSLKLLYKLFHSKIIKFKLFKIIKLSENSNYLNN